MGLLFTGAYKLIHFAVYGLTVLGFLALLVRRPRHAAWAGWLGGAGLTLFAVVAFDLMFVGSGPDYDWAFYPAGVEVAAGRDPIATLAENTYPPLNPPTSYPLFGLFGVLGKKGGFLVLTLASALSLAALVPVSARTLAGRGAALPPRPVLVLLASLVVLSISSRSILGNGQLSAITSLVLLLALLFQGRGRPVAAGVNLALATIKIGTMLPYLLLFLRRRDVLAWLAMVVTVFALCAPIGRLADAPRRVRLYVDAIGRLSGEGKINDYSYAGPETEDMVGIDYTLYRLGMRDRRAIAATQAAILVVLGAALAVRVARRSGLADGADVSLVVLYSLLFLYHRLAEMVLLAFPLTYATGRALADAGRSRRWFVAAALAMVVDLSVQRKAVGALERAVVSGRLSGWAGRLVEVVVLPHATWALGVALACLWLAPRRPEADGVAAPGV